MQLIEIVRTKFVVATLVADQMEPDYQDIVRHGDDGSLLTSPGGNAVVLGGKICPLTSGRTPTNLTQHASDPRITFARLPRPSLASTLVTPWTHSGPGGQMLFGGKGLQPRSQFGDQAPSGHFVDARNRDPLLNFFLKGAHLLRDASFQFGNLPSRKRWCSVTRPRKASRRAGSFARSRQRAISANRSGSSSPRTIASRIARPEIPKISVTTEASFRLASSSTFSIRFTTRARSPSSVAR